jgi:hypothetical protein
VRLSPIDDLEELPLPRPLPLVRQCSKRGCRRTARPGGRYCRPCATTATRRWRDRHADELAERERGRIFSDEDRLIRKARAYVAEYIKRGKLARERCGVCGEPEVLAAWDDPRKPREVRWLCAEHYADRRDSHREAAEARVRLSSEWADVRAQLALLPPELQTELHEIALKGPAGHGARLGSPFYWWTLRREIQRYAARQSSGTFWT